MYQKDWFSIDKFPEHVGSCLKTMDRDGRGVLEGGKKFKVGHITYFPSEEGGDGIRLSPREFYMASKPLEILIDKNNRVVSVLNPGGDLSEALKILSRK